MLLLLSGGRAMALPEDACIKDEKCKEHYTKAVKFYKEELFDDALTEFQAAYTARAMPLLLVNIGRTLQKLGRPKEALSHYERFLAAESRIDPETKQRIDGYIAQVKALIGSEPEKPTVIPEQPKTPPPPALPPPPPPPPPGRNLVIAGAVIAAIGVGGVITSIALGSISQGHFSTFNDSDDEFAKLDAKASAQTFSSGAVIAGILGAAVGVTGGVLIGVGVRQMNNFKRSEGVKTLSGKPQARLLPWAGPSGAGLVLQGGF
jgi:tetratricopeptide (TPR) repeat protein